MSCFCGRRESDGNDLPKILDVEQILTDYVWDTFLEKKNKVQRLCLRRKDFTVNVPMNYFLFETFKQRVTPRFRPEIGADGPVLEPKNTTNEKAALPKSKFGKGMTKNSNIVEISTDFVNDTDREQTYRFRLEKTRKATLSVTFQKGFTIGGKARFSVELPKLVSGAQIGTETDMTINVTKQEGENVEETVVLETTSDIKVKERSKYVAKAVMAETRVSYDFAVWCRISMPMGGFPGSVVRKKDGEIFFSCAFKNLKTIFEPFQNQVKIVSAPTDGEVNNYVIEIKNTGIIEGVRLSDQRIVLESSDLLKPSKRDGVSDDDDKVTSDKLTGTTYPYTTASLQRPRSIDGPIIEEMVETEDQDRSKSAVVVASNRVQTRTLTNRPPVTTGLTPTIVASSPSSVGSSPFSEKSGSQTSISNNTSTTV